MSVTFATAIAALALAVAMSLSQRVPDASELPRDCSVPSGVAPMSLTAAGRSKGYVASAASEGNNVLRDLSGAIRRSDLVVVAFVKNARCVAGPSYGMIFTHYAVEAVEVLKGAPPLAYPINIVERGGRIVSSDGRWHEVQVPQVTPLRVGGRYVLFLIPGRLYLSPDDEAQMQTPRYDLLSEGYAAFELGTDGKVKPARTTSVGVAGTYRGRPNADFLDEIRRLLVS